MFRKCWLSLTPFTETTERLCEFSRLAGSCTFYLNYFFRLATKYNLLVSLGIPVNVEVNFTLEQAMKAGMGV